MPTPAQNVETVLSFLRTAFGEGRPQDAVETFVGDTYVQHSPGVRDGKEGFVEMAREMAAAPGSSYPDTKLVIATEEYVVLLTHFVDASGASPGRASVDIMRLDGAGRIVEHWDVAQDVPPAEEFLHDNGMF